MTAATQQQHDYRPEPPANYEAEQGLLAMILHRNAHYDTAVEAGLEAQHFADDLHGRIFEAAATLIGQGKTASAVTLNGLFAGQSVDQDRSVRDYLVSLQGADVIGIASQAKDYAGTIIELWQAREAMAMSEDLAWQVAECDLETPIGSLIEDHAGRLMELREGPQAMSATQSLASASAAWLANVEAAFKAGGVLGVPTGFTALDEKLGGLVKTDLIVLAGRTAQGKTALATGIAENVAKAGAPVLFCSLEMGADQIAGRIIAGHTGIPVTHQRSGRIEDWQMEALIRAKEDLDAMPLHFEMPRLRTVAALRARARAMKRRQGLELIVVDYIQLMAASGHYRGNRVQEVSEITRDLKGLAMGLDVPVLALSQVSRQSEARDDKRPDLSDLRESGSIEQDADTVLFVFREYEYERKAEPKKRERESEEDFQARHFKWEDNLTRVANVGQVLIRKNRHGPTGDVTLGFEGSRTRFRNLAADEQAQEGLL